MTATAPAPARKPLPNSPCIGVCEMDEDLGLCRGCARNAEEIADWRDAEDAWRATVWSDLPARAERLGITLRRLDWEPPAILDFVAETLEEARGTWVLGVYGAVAEVMRVPGETLEIRRTDAEIEALMPQAALRLAAPRGTRAFSWQEAAERPTRIVLALPKVRLGEPGPGALTPLGPDEAALLPGTTGQPRFDLGLGRAEARFTLRISDMDAAEWMARAAGRPWPEHLAIVGPAARTEGAHRVIETPLGRAEVSTPLPPPDGRTPEGPHTHLLPDFIAQGFAVPPTLVMPSAFAVAAIFYPAA